MKLIKLSIIIFIANPIIPYMLFTKLDIRNNHTSTGHGGPAMYFAINLFVSCAHFLTYTIVAIFIKRRNNTLEKITSLSNCIINTAIFAYYNILLQMHYQQDHIPKIRFTRIFNPRRLFHSQLVDLAQHLDRKTKINKPPIYNAAANAERPTSL